MEVQCLDSIKKFWVNPHTTFLFELPPEFRGIPPKIILVYLGGIVPIDGMWPQKSLNLVKDNIRARSDDSYRVVGTVHKTFNGVIILNELKINEVLYASNIQVPEFNVAETLKKQNYAMQDVHGMQLMAKLIQDYGKCKDILKI